METKVNNICTPPLWSKNYLNPTPPQKGCLSSSVKLLVFCARSISELGLAFFTVIFISPLASYVLRAGWRLSFQLVLKSEDLWDSGNLYFTAHSLILRCWGIWFALQSHLQFPVPGRSIHCSPVPNLKAFTKTSLLKTISAQNLPVVGGSLVPCQLKVSNLP